MYYSVFLVVCYLYFEWLSSNLWRTRDHVIGFYPLLDIDHLSPIYFLIRSAMFYLCIVVNVLGFFSSLCSSFGSSCNVLGSIDILYLICVLFIFMFCIYIKWDSIMPSFTFSLFDLCLTFIPNLFNFVIILGISILNLCYCYLIFIIIGFNLFFSLIGYSLVIFGLFYSFFTLVLHLTNRLGYFSLYFNNSFVCFSDQCDTLTWLRCHTALIYVFNRGCRVSLRWRVNDSLICGLCLVEAFLPIGRGQRQLILGDRSIGKTSIYLTLIIMNGIFNYIGSIDGCLSKRLFAIYIGINQNLSKISKLINCLLFTFLFIIILSPSSLSALLSFLIPFCGISIAERLRDRGFDTVICFDDFSQHSKSYRQISLILAKIPSRDAFPADIFNIHSSLLERCGKLKYGIKGGSITGFPIIETINSDITDYIATNIISITDGQFYLDKKLFLDSIRPAFDSALSVSRIGSAAQSKWIKSVSGGIKNTLTYLRKETQLNAELRLLTLLNSLNIIFYLNHLSPQPIEYSIILLLTFSQQCLFRNLNDRLRLDFLLLFDFIYLYYLLFISKSSFNYSCYWFVNSFCLFLTALLSSNAYLRSFSVYYYFFLFDFYLLVTRTFIFVFIYDFVMNCWELLVFVFNFFLMFYFNLSFIIGIVFGLLFEFYILNLLYLLLVLVDLRVIHYLFYLLVCFFNLSVIRIQAGIYTLNWLWFLLVLFNLIYLICSVYFLFNLFIVVPLLTFVFINSLFCQDHCFISYSYLIMVLFLLLSFVLSSKLIFVSFIYYYLICLICVLIFVYFIRITFDRLGVNLWCYNSKLIIPFFVSFVYYYIFVSFVCDRLGFSIKKCCLKRVFYLNYSLRYCVFSWYLLLFLIVYFLLFVWGIQFLIKSDKFKVLMKDLNNSSFYFLSFYIVVSWTFNLVFIYYCCVLSFLFSFVFNYFYRTVSFASFVIYVTYYFLYRLMVLLVKVRRLYYYFVNFTQAEIGPIVLPKCSFYEFISYLWNCSFNFKQVKHLLFNSSISYIYKICYKNGLLWINKVVITNRQTSISTTITTRNSTRKTNNYSLVSSRKQSIILTLNIKDILNDWLFTLLALLYFFLSCLILFNYFIYLVLFIYLLFIFII